MTTIEYLESKGLESVGEVRAGREVIMSPCPHCDKESTAKDHHFTVRKDTGVGFCFSCKGRGNLIVYKQKYGDFERKEKKESASVARWRSKLRQKAIKQHTMKVPKDIVSKGEHFLWHDFDFGKQARDYLMKDRGYLEETLRRWRIGLIPRAKCTADKEDCDFFGVVNEDKKCVACGSPTSDRVYWSIAIPVLSGDGQLQLVKYRSLPPDKMYSRETDGVTSLYGIHLLDSGINHVVITESELDAVAGDQYGLGNVISIGGSSNAGSDNWDDSWREALVRFDEIYLALDNDKAGIEAAEKVADKLGPFRCKYVSFPDAYKDLAQMQEECVPTDQVLGMLVDAQPVQKNLWTRGKDLYSSVVKSLNPDRLGYLTSWPRFNKLFGPVKPGELTVVTSQTASGKSLFTNQLALDMASNGIPCGVASFELRLDQSGYRVLNQYMEQPLVEFKSDKWIPVVPEEDIYVACEALDRIPFHMLDIYGSMELDGLYEYIRWGVKKYGIKILVLDHLHYFLPGLGGRDEHSIISNAMKSLVNWCADLDIHIFLVAHPSKAKKSAADGPVYTGSSDLKGSSAIEQDAYNIITLYRARGYERVTRLELDKPLCATLLSIPKSRSPLGREGDVWFHFDPYTLLFKETLNEAEGRSIRVKDHSGYGKQYDQILKKRYKKTDKDKTDKPEKKGKRDKPLSRQKANDTDIPY